MKFKLCYFRFRPSLKMEIPVSELGLRNPVILGKKLSLKDNAFIFAVIYDVE
jgi:hypothetical protein